jgi:hypothetical protein
MKPAVYACGDQVSVPVPNPEGARHLDFGRDVKWLRGEVVSYRLNSSGAQLLTVKVGDCRLLKIAASLCRGSKVSGATP